MMSYDVNGSLALDDILLLALTYPKKHTHTHNFLGVLEIGPQFKAGADEATAAASFTVINTGNVDGFTTVEMVAQREVISSNRYFVAAGARQIKSLIAPNLHSSMSFDEISIRVGTIEPA